MANKWLTNVGWLQTGWAKEASVVSLPEVVTNEAASVTDTTAASGGTCTFAGGDTVSAKGVCWSTTIYPTTADDKTDEGAGVGSFASSITGLTAETQYHYRAYATNAAGTAYGADMTFTTGESQFTARGLIAYYTFDEGSGQVLTDRSGHGHNGQLGSTAGADANDPAWNSNGLTFTTNDYVTVAAHADWETLVEDVTVQVVSFPPAGSSGALFWRAAAYAAAPFGVYTANAGDRVTISRGSGGDVNEDGLAFSGAFHLMTIREESGALTTAKDNGTPFATATFVPPYTDAGAAYGVGIGGRLLDAWSFGGSVAFLAVYNVALTDEELAANYTYIKTLMAARSITLP